MLSSAWSKQAKCQLAAQLMLCVNSNNGIATPHEFTSYADKETILLSSCAVYLPLSQVSWCEFEVRMHGRLSFCFQKIDDHVRSLATQFETLCCVNWNVHPAEDSRLRHKEPVPLETTPTYCYVLCR